MSSEYEELKVKIKEYIIDNVETKQLSDEDLRDKIVEVTQSVCQGIYMPIRVKAEISEEIFDSIRGFGILDSLLKDDGITEVLINGVDRVFYEKDGRLIRETRKFESETQLTDIIERIVALAGKAVDSSDPILDVRLPDGSHIHVVLPPIAPDGPIVTIRKAPKTPLMMAQLVENGSVTQDVADVLEQFVKARYNILISGVSGVGKTTVLNALAGLIPKDERVITIEDGAELRITDMDDLVRLEARNATGDAEAVTVRKLIRTALHMRPDRILVGVLHGDEAPEMLRAMHAGLDGSMATGYAISVRDLISRLESMSAQSGAGLSARSVRQQIASSVEIVVHVSRLRDHSRRITEICEVVGYKEKEIQLNPLYVFREDEHSAPDKVSGALVRTENPLVHDLKLRLAGFAETV